MKIGVCLKQVPDPQGRVRPRGRGADLVLEEAPPVLNESDACALEAALLLAERQAARGAGESDEVVAFALGDASVEEMLRRALALGASRAVRVGGAAVEGYDPLSIDPFAVAAALALVVAAERCDLVLTGSQSQDRGHAAVPAALAGELGWPWLWLAVEIEPHDDEGTLTVRQELEAGRFARWRVPLPAVVAVQSGANQPRMTSVRGVMAARRKTIELSEVGELGPSRLEWVEVEAPAQSEGAELLDGDPTQAAHELVRRLREAGVL